MRITLALVLSIVVAVGLVAFGFTFYQISTERTRLLSEHIIRTRKVAEEIYQNNNNFLELLNRGNIEHLSDSLSIRYNLLGIAVYFNSDSVLISNSSRNIIGNSLSYISKSIATGTSSGNFISMGS